MLFSEDTEHKMNPYKMKTSVQFQTDNTSSCWGFGVFYCQLQTAFHLKSETIRDLTDVRDFDPVISKTMRKSTYVAQSHRVFSLFHFFIMQLHYMAGIGIINLIPPTGTLHTWHFLHCWEICFHAYLFTNHVQNSSVEFTCARLYFVTTCFPVLDLNDSTSFASGEYSAVCLCLHLCIAVGLL